MDMHISLATRLLIVGLSCAASVDAQFPQYTAPGSLGVPQKPTRERVEAGVEAARWTLGALKLDPRFRVGDVGYNDNVFGASDDGERISDLTATVGAGLVAYSNFGPDVIVSAYLLPEYVWWQDLDQLREERLNYGAGVFGFFNRLTLIADARREERQRFLNAEALVPFDIQTHRASIRAAVDFRGPFELFGAIEAREFEHQGNRSPIRVELLDRDEAIGRLGLAYRFRSDLRIGLGAEGSESDFPLDPFGRSNTALGPLLEIDYHREGLSLALSAVQREVEFEAPSRRTFSELTGSLRAGWQAGHRLQLDAYGARSLVYSIAGDDQFFAEDRVGLSVGTPWGRRFHVRAYGESGSNRYRSVSRAVTSREDDVTSFGGELDFEPSPRLLLTLAASSTDFDSNQPGLDRSVAVVHLGLRLGGDFQPW